MIDLYKDFFAKNLHKIVNLYLAMTPNESVGNKHSLKLPFYEVVSIYEIILRCLFIVKILVKMSQNDINK
jgi:hypothetical protein